MFTLSQTQIELQQAARKFAQNELRGLADECEATNHAVSKEWRKKYADLGFLGINTAHKYGGLGLSHLDALIVLEEFAKISSAVAFPVFESVAGPVKALEHFGSERLREKVLPRVNSGEIVVAVAMSEADAGSALTDLKTRGEIKGDKIIINGAKRWCSGGGHSEGYIVYLRLSDAPHAKGLGAVYVEKGVKGLSFGQSESLMGFRGIPSADIYFDNVEVPLENLVVPAGGFPKLMEAFDLERCGNSTMCLGLASGALEDAKKYVEERSQFGRKLADFQAIQMRLAEMAMDVEAMRLLIWRAASNAANGLPSVHDSSIAKCFANEAVRRVCLHGLQIMGGYGYATAGSMEKRVRDSIGWGIAGGTIDIQKINIASALLGRRFNQRG